MAIRFQHVLPLTALAAFLASGVAVAAQDQHAVCCEPQVMAMAAPLAKAGPRDPYAEGARLGTRDPYTDGARVGPRDPYTDGGVAQPALEARVGPRDPYTDGGLIVSPRGRDPYTDGASA